MTTQELNPHLTPELHPHLTTPAPKAWRVVARVPTDVGTGTIYAARGGRCCLDPAGAEALDADTAEALARALNAADTAILADEATRLPPWVVEPLPEEASD